MTGGEPHHRRALTLARLADAIYDPESGFADHAKSRGLEVADWHDHAGTQVAHVLADQWAAVIFRGTQVLSGGGLFERIGDIRFNLRIWPTRWHGPGRAHSGYHSALGRVRPAAERMIGATPWDRPLYITGHSLGGALATLCAIEAALRGSHPRTHLVTFGAPKAATAEALAPLGRPGMTVHRYVIDGDAATIWPPSWTLDHPGEALALDPGGFLERRHGSSKYVEALMREILESESRLA